MIFTALSILVPVLESLVSRASCCGVERTCVSTSVPGYGSVFVVFTHSVVPLFTLGTLEIVYTARVLVTENGVTMFMFFPVVGRLQ